MIYKLIVSQEAHSDIDDIVHYIFSELQNKNAAINFLNDVEKSYKNIIQNPFMYNLCNDDKLRYQGYRKIPIKNYIILYIVDGVSETVSIMRIIYGGRNYTELI